jgi:arylsulfatase A-like enzyme
MDWCVGEMIRALSTLGVSENTLVVFSSDNGPVLDDGYQDRAVELCGDHRPAGPLRGGKYSMFDGGTRVPFILRWPNGVTPGESSAVVSHVDLLASFASLLGVPLEANAAPDSLDMRRPLLGRTNRGRHELATEGAQALTVLRQGDWVFIPPHDGPPVNATTGIETGRLPETQLYDLSMDIGQIRNVAAEHRDMVSSMSDRLKAIRDGRQTRP